jgi:hypothetical protein
VVKMLPCYFYNSASQEVPSGRAGSNPVYFEMNSQLFLLPHPGSCSPASAFCRRRRWMSRLARPCCGDGMQTGV